MSKKFWSDIFAFVISLLFFLIFPFFLRRFRVQKCSRVVPREFLIAKLRCVSCFNQKIPKKILYQWAVPLSCTPPLLRFPPVNHPKETHVCSANVHGRPDGGSWEVSEQILRKSLLIFWGRKPSKIPKKIVMCYGEKMWRGSVMGALESMMCVQCWHTFLTASSSTKKTLLGDSLRRKMPRKWPNLVFRLCFDIRGKPRWYSPDILLFLSSEDFLVLFFFADPEEKI